MVRKPAKDLEVNPVVETAKGAAAAAAIASPWWLTILKSVSDGAALVLPILGVIWLVIQMTSWFLKRKDPK